MATRDGWVAEGRETETMRATRVVAEGPFPNRDGYGDEFGEYAVVPMDDAGNETGRVSYFRSRGAAVTFAGALAARLRVEIVNDTFPL